MPSTTSSQPIPLRTLRLAVAAAPSITATTTRAAASSSPPTPATPVNLRLKASRWAKGFHLFKMLIKAVIGVAAVLGLGAAIFTAYLAVWTSAKDFKDDCRMQNATLAFLPESCSRVLSKALRPPPFINAFISERLRRDTGFTTAEKDSELLVAGPFYFCAFAFIVIVILAVIGFIIRQLNRQRVSRLLGIIHCSCSTSSHCQQHPQFEAWVPNTVARWRADTQGLRRRHTTRPLTPRPLEPSLDANNKGGEEEWLPVRTWDHLKSEAEFPDMTRLKDRTLTLDIVSQTSQRILLYVWLALALFEPDAIIPAYLHKSKDALEEDPPGFAIRVMQQRPAAEHQLSTRLGFLSHIRQCAGQKPADVVSINMPSRSNPRLDIWASATRSIPIDWGSDFLLPDGAPAVAMTIQQDERYISIKIGDGQDCKNVRTIWNALRELPSQNKSNVLIGSEEARIGPSGDGMWQRLLEGVDFLTVENFSTTKVELSGLHNTGQLAVGPDGSRSEGDPSADGLVGLTGRSNQSGAEANEVENLNLAKKSKVQEVVGTLDHILDLLDLLEHSLLANRLPALPYDEDVPVYVPEFEGPSGKTIVLSLWKVREEGLSLREYGQLEMTLFKLFKENLAPEVYRRCEEQMTSTPTVMLDFPRSIPNGMTLHNGNTHRETKFTLPEEYLHPEGTSDIALHIKFDRDEEGRFERAWHLPPVFTLKSLHLFINKQQEPIFSAAIAPLLRELPSYRVDNLEDLGIEFPRDMEDYVPKPFFRESVKQKNDIDDTLSIERIVQSTTVSEERSELSPTVFNDGNGLSRWGNEDYNSALNYPRSNFGHRFSPRDNSNHIGKCHFCPHESCKHPSTGLSPSFSRKADLSRHIKSTHGPVYLDCAWPKCDRVGLNGFTRRDHLVEHRRGYHNDATPKREVYASRGGSH